MTTNLKVHAEVYGEDQGGFRIFEQMIHLAYYWPAIEAMLLSLLKSAKYVSSMATRLCSWIA